MQRALESRMFISAVLAMAAGKFLFYAHPFPDHYTPGDFTIPEDSPDAPPYPAHAEESKPNTRQGHKGQPEQDWAYAKRALALGDDFEEVVRKIADFRAQDKHSPESYARRTVTKARAELDLERFKSK
jgi:hypothetical protein